MSAAVRVVVVVVPLVHRLRPDVVYINAVARLVR